MILKALSALYLIMMMLGLGLELGGGPKESRAEKWSKRRALVTGVLVNLVLLPLVAFAVTRALHVSSAVSVALLLLAAAPGGRYAPHAVRLAKGDVALSVEVTLVLAKITCFTAVPTAKWMLTLRTLEIHELPFLLQLILLQVLPLYFGKWLRKRRPDLAERFRRAAVVAALAAGLLILAVASAHTEKWLSVLEGRGWLAVACVGVVSPFLGWLLGGPHPGRRRAFAIGAGAREIGLALVMAGFAYPRPEVHTAILGVGFVFTISSFLLAWVLRTAGGRRPTAASAPTERPLADSG